MEQSDGRGVLLQKLGYSPTKSSLHIVPNCWLWSGGLESRLPSKSANAVHKEQELGTLLFEEGRNYSLVLLENNADGTGEMFEKVGDTIDEDLECLTPKFNSHVPNLGESGYSTFHSSYGSTKHSTDDVIITSSPNASNKCTTMDKSECTIVYDTEDEIEDPLCFVESSSTTRPCALPGLFSHQLHARPKDIVTNIDSRGPYFLPPRTDTKMTSHRSSEMDEHRSTNKGTNRFDHSQLASSNDVIVISSSDEGDRLRPSSALISRRQTDTINVSANSSQSSDEGIVLDCVWEEELANGLKEGNARGSALPQSEVHGNQLRFVSGAYNEDRLAHEKDLSVQPAMIKCCGFQLSPADLKSLEPHQWLNDQVSQLSLLCTCMYVCSNY